MVPRGGQAAVEGDHGVQETVDRQPPGDEVDAQVAGEEQVRLARLDGDAGGIRPSSRYQAPGRCRAR